MKEGFTFQMKTWIFIPCSNDAIVVYAYYKAKSLTIFFSAPCSAGDYMTESGCQQCEENTYSGAGASSCTSCPDSMISAAGSTSVDDCEYGTSIWNHLRIIIRLDHIVIYIS